LATIDLRDVHVQVIHDESHVSLEFAQEIFYLLFGSVDPLNSLPLAGLLKLLQDTVQFFNEILDLNQASIFALFSQTVHRWAVAFQDLCKTLSSMSAKTTASRKLHQVSPNLPQVAVASWIPQHSHA
jgi:hypothetical protein